MEVIELREKLDTDASSYPSLVHELLMMMMD